MGKTTKRKFGEIPAWALKGPITAANYDLRAEWHGARKKLEANWPFLSHDPDVPATADAPAWDRYFGGHLGEYPASYQLFRAGKIKFYNVPEEQPELFDTSYNPSLSISVSRPPVDPLARFFEGPRHQQEFCNLFVPRGAPGFDVMVQAAKDGRLGVWAAPMYAQHGRTFNPGDYYRYDSVRDGIHVNLKDYQSIVGMAR